MKVLVIGAGNMGSGFVKRFAAADHQVAVTSRSSEKAQALAKEAGAQAVTSAEGAKGRDIIVLATPYDQAVDALKSLGDLTNKIIVDATNPLSADFMSLTVGHTTSAAESIAAAVPGANVVKAFNTIFAQVLSQGTQFGESKAPVFIAGDDAQAKDAVTKLAKSIGFDAIDAGNLKNARYLEPLAGLNIYLGYGAGLGTRIAPTWLGRS